VHKGETPSAVSEEDCVIRARSRGLGSQSDASPCCNPGADVLTDPLDTANVSPPSVWQDWGSHRDPTPCQTSKAILSRIWKTSLPGFGPKLTCASRSALPDRRAGRGSSRPRWSREALHRQQIVRRCSHQRRAMRRWRKPRPVQCPSKVPPPVTWKPLLLPRPRLSPSRSGTCILPTAS